MIEVKKEKDFCEGCPMFDPEITKETLYSGSELFDIANQITCKHRVFCNNMEARLRKSLDK